MVGEVLEVGSAVKDYQPEDLVSGSNPVPIPGITSYWGGQASLHLYTAVGEGPVLLPKNADPIDWRESGA